MLPPRRYDAILFDVGGTLLDVTHDPRERAVAAVAHLGTVSAAAFETGIRQAVEEWRAAGGRPPHPAIFRIATSALGAEPRRALLVGDSVELDLMGAAAAGMDAVLLDRTGRHPSRQPRIRSLAELPGLLERQLLI